MGPRLIFLGLYSVGLATAKEALGAHVPAYAVQSFNFSRSVTSCASAGVAASATAIPRARMARCIFQPPIGERGRTPATLILLRLNLWVNPAFACVERLAHAVSTATPRRPRPQDARQSARARASGHT